MSSDRKSGPIPTNVANLASVATDIDGYFNGPIPQDFFRMMCGDRIGHGVSRTVYACRLDPKFVIKFEATITTFQNVMEWELWSALKKTPMEKWLAPCDFISPCGTVLIQRKTQPIDPADIPKRVPAWVCDMDVHQWGRFDGRAVLHDYGYTYLLTNARRARLKDHTYLEKIEGIDS